MGCINFDGEIARKYGFIQGIIFSELKTLCSPHCNFAYKYKGRYWVSWEFREDVVATKEQYKKALNNLVREKIVIKADKEDELHLTSIEIAINMQGAENVDTVNTNVRSWYTLPTAVVEE